MSSQVGTLLNGRYRLDAQIGTGGMSTVYRAFDTVLERQVAIKLMHREIASDSDQLERFRREARAVAQLNHPHIVTVIDAGEDDNMPYIVFEYVEGETLKDRIRRYGRLPIQESIAYAIEIARALGVAHDRGIVHRDVKPQNVLVDEEGSAKVTDFGIARTLDQEGLTADGRVLGTTDYVSPEQALGHPVTGQSDLYSLGIVLFEMLTGDVPFKGDNQVAVAMKHVREQLPDVQIRRPEVSNALAAVLEKATAKETEKRYADDRALIADLEEVLAIETQRSGQSTGEATAVLRTLPPSAQRRLPARVIHPVRLVAALVVIAAVVVAAVLLLADRTERGTAQRPVVRSAPAQGVKSVSLGQARAHDFDPYGDDHDEHSGDVGRVLDGDPGTAWTTETYRGGFGTKPGVGIYVDAKPGVVGKRLEIRTTTPGWTGKVYVSNSASRSATNLDGWQDIGANVDATKTSIAVPLDTAGPFGEDGTVQGLLELLDVPYVGSGVMASAVCMDKVVFKDLMAQAGIPQVAYALVTRTHPPRERPSLEHLGYPQWVKPARLGSSVGIVRVQRPEDLDAALDEAFSHDDRVIVEANSTGLEIESSVLGDTHAPRVSQPGEIVLLRDGWYDYEAKYSEGGMRLQFPARISPTAIEQLRATAARAFTAAGCSGLARADFFVDGETVLLNELNTLPGQTPTSVYGVLWERSGLPYPYLVDELCRIAVARFERERALRH